MRNAILRLVYAAAVFVLAVFLFESLMNHESTDVTADMDEATFPVVIMEEGTARVNELHGNASARDISHYRTCITPIDEDRTVSFAVESCGADITGLSFEVRTLDGGRLIENNSIDEADWNRDSDGNIEASLQLQNLIEDGTEYMFILLVTTTSDDTIRYYTRIAETAADDRSVIDEELVFVQQFHDDAIAKKRDILDQCLETDQSLDNNDYSHVTINSTTVLAMYGDLAVSEVLTPVTEIRDISGTDCMFRMNYILTCSDAGTDKYYECTEYYRVRQGTDRIYLLDFDRTMNQIYVPKDNGSLSENQISLGITGDADLVESQGGSAFAFVNAGRLYGCIPERETISTIFSFGNADSTDLRETNREYGIKILNVDETGNVDFIVYGYMNRGRHEGQTGVAVYEYNNEYRTDEEMAFIPYDGSYELLKSQVDRLTYYNKSNRLLILIDETIYNVNLTNAAVTVEADGLATGAYQVSDDAQMFAYGVDGMDEYGTTAEIRLMNFQTMRESSITADSGVRLVPLGFISEDLIYGKAGSSDIVRDASGRVILPMSEVLIVSPDLQVLEDYSVSGYYVTGCTIEGNQITFSRVSKDEASGSYVDAEPDEILQNKEEDSGSASIVTDDDDMYLTVRNISFHNFSGRNITYIEPKFVLFEGSRDIDTEAAREAYTADSTGNAQEQAGSSTGTAQTDGSVFFVYDLYGVTGFCDDLSRAVALADESAGFITDDSGRYIWKKYGRLESNQIMAITGTADDGSGSIAACLKAIFDFEGAVGEDPASALASGGDIPEIIEQTVPDSEAFTLTGCSLDAVLYYVSVEKPVLALYGGAQEAELIVGYNDSIVVLMNPATGKLERVQRTAAEEQFTGSGCSYVVYLTDSGE